MNINVCARTSLWVFCSWLRMKAFSFFIALSTALPVPVLFNIILVYWEFLSGINVGFCQIIFFCIYWDNYMIFPFWYFNRVIDFFSSVNITLCSWKHFTYCYSFKIYRICGDVTSFIPNIDNLCCHLFFLISLPRDILILLISLKNLLLVPLISLVFSFSFHWLLLWILLFFFLLLIWGLICFSSNFLSWKPKWLIWDIFFFFLNVTA